MTLNVIGCGRVGKPLVRLLVERGVFVLQGVVNRTPQSSSHAVEFIGSGTPLVAIADLQPADVYLVAVPDSQLASISEMLSCLPGLPSSAILFHCSGAYGSSLFESLQRNDGDNRLLGSLHPVKSFADPQTSFETFDGTPCSLEGGERFFELASRWVASIGGRPFRISSEAKLLYHVSLALASNYTVALYDLALRTCHAAGVEPEIAQRCIDPLLQGTIDNLKQFGPVRALTGPIVRGDLNLVRDHLKVIHEKMPEAEATYRVLGERLVGLARESNESPAEKLGSIEQLLHGKA